MSDTDTPHIPAALELAELVRPTWAAIDERIARSGHPTNEGEPDPSPDPDQDPDPDPDDTPSEVDHKAEAEKWKGLARKHEKQAKANAGAAKKLQEAEDAKKSETQRAAEKAAEAETRATTAEATALRLDVAMDKAPDGMSVAQVRKLAKRLAGSTREELEEDADELFADYAPSAGNGKGTRSGRRPTERLRPGASPSDADDDDGETDPSKLAAKVPRQYS